MESNDLTNTDNQHTERDSFVFYRSFYDAINEVSEHDQLTIYRTIVNYALDREEPNLEGVAKIAWVLIKPQLDANWRRYEKGCRGAEAGKRGGRPRKNPLGVIPKTPNDNVNVNVNDNVNVNEFSLDNKINNIPSLSDIILFTSENKLNVDPLQFYDYYSSNGWMLGSKSMADWRASLRNWDRNAHKHLTPIVSPLKPIYDDL